MKLYYVDSSWGKKFEVREVEVIKETPKMYKLDKNRKYHSQIHKDAIDNPRSDYFTTGKLAVETLVTSKLNRIEYLEKEMNKLHDQINMLSCL